MKKNILIIVPHLKIGGGAEKIAALVGSNINRKKFNVHFLTFYDFNPKYDFKGDYHSLFEKTSTNIFYNIFKLFIRAYKIKNYSKSKNIDSITSFMEEANFPNILSKVLFRNRSKIIISVRNNPLKYSKNKFYLFLIRYLYPYSDKIVCLSKGVEYYLKKNYNLLRTKTIYNSLNVNNIEKSLKENSDLKKYGFYDKNIFKFITIGRLNVQKGQKYLLKSFRLVVDKFPNSKLYIVGDGELKSELKTLVKKLNLNKNVIFLGRQNNVFKFLNCSDCYVFSSLWEGFATVLLEALYFEIPIISTDCDFGPREILAPKILVSKKINYPYFGEYGVLVENFLNDEFQLNGFSNKEQLFSNEMINFIQNKNFQKNLNNRVNDFSLNKIILDWEKEF